MVCPLWPLFNRSDSRRVGMVNSIVNNNPANWGYGCVFFLCLLPLYSRIFGFIYEVHTQTTLTTGLRTVCLCHLCFYIANLHFFFLHRANSLLRGQLSKTKTAERSV